MRTLYSKLYISYRDCESSLLSSRFVFGVDSLWLLEPLMNGPPHGKNDYAEGCKIC